MRHNVRLYYNFSFPTSQRTLCSSIIKKSVIDVYRNTHINTLYGDMFNLFMLSLCLYLAAVAGKKITVRSGIKIKPVTATVLTLRRLMSYIYIYGAPILDVSRSHTTTQHTR